MVKWKWRTVRPSPYLVSWYTVLYESCFHLGQFHQLCNPWDRRHPWYRTTCAVPRAKCVYLGLCWRTGGEKCKEARLGLPASTTVTVTDPPPHTHTRKCVHECMYLYWGEKRFHIFKCLNTTRLDGLCSPLFLKRLSWRWKGGIYSCKKRDNYVINRLHNR